MNLSHWSLPRRVTAGFSLLLLLIIGQGLFAMSRLGQLNQVLSGIADNSMPSVAVLGELGSEIRDQFLMGPRITAAINAKDDAERARLQGIVQDKEKHVQELLQNYETSLINNAEDQRLFDAIRKAHNDVATTREKMIQLTREGNFKEHDRLSSEVQQVNRTRLLEAISAAAAYNDKIGRQEAGAGKAEAASAQRAFQSAVAASVLVAALLAWLTLGATRRTLKAVSSDLNRGAMQTAATASQFAMSSHSLSSGASEQAAAVEETSASLEEMLSMVRTTSDNAQKAKQLASEARHLAESGQQTVTDMLEAMGQIGNAGQDVAKIVKNIDEIAFQTNILALNAAVEAARAGEAGAGFAVVADEVRSLAQRSAAAARETAEKIDAAISSTRRGRQCSAEVERSLVEISAKVVATDQVVGEIATAAREQAQGITQIGTAITQIDRISQTNSATAEQSASAAEELNQQAEALRESVTQLQQLAGGKPGTAVAPLVRPRATPTARFRGKVETPQDDFAPRAPSPALSGRPKHTLGSIPMPDYPQQGDDEDANFTRY